MTEKKSKKKPIKQDKKSSTEERREEVIEKINENVEKAEETEEKEQPKRKQVVEENKMLLIFVGVLILIAATFITYLLVYHSANAFTYRGVKYTIEQDGKITFYHTTVPFINQGKLSSYSLWIRNDPRTLETTVPFYGNLSIKQYMTLNYSNALACNGYGTIAIQNLMDLYSAIGTKVIYDPNATCDPQQRYVYINIKVSNETSVRETAPSCYTININNCEILQGTERYMTETFAAIKS